VDDFDEYVASLSQLSVATDPTLPTAQSEEIREIAVGLGGMGEVTAATLVQFIEAQPEAVPVLGLTVGLTREKLKNVLRHRLGSSSWTRLTKEKPAELIAVLDEHYDLVRLLTEQRFEQYNFGDVLVARAGSRATANLAAVRGRRLEDDLEAVAKALSLPYATRTRFEGRNGQTAPCDLAIPAGNAHAQIVVAAKGFDSTGSKLTDAVREVEQMANHRRPAQFVMAVVDGIGWKSRLSDLKRIHDLWTSNQIDGLYTLERLGDFRTDLEAAAKVRGLL